MEQSDLDTSGIISIYLLQLICIPLVSLLVWQIQRSRFEGDLPPHNNFESVQDLLRISAVTWAVSIVIYIFIIWQFFEFNATTIMLGASTVGLVFIVCVVGLAAYTTGYADGVQDARAETEAAEGRSGTMWTDVDHRESVEQWLTRND